MRERKYTQGPWECGGEVCERLATFDNGQHNIYPPTGEAGPIAEVGGQANAHLVAAAPELLEALEAVEQYRNAHHTYKVSVDSLLKGKIDAVIAKAYGEKP